MTEEEKKYFKKIKALKDKELDYTTVYMTGRYDEKDKWKQKIKDKIKEIKERTKDDCIALHEFQREAKIDALQELLEGDDN